MDRLATRVLDRVRSLSVAQWALVVVMIGAAVLRFKDLGAESLWLDELTSLLQTGWSPARIVTESVTRGTPPLYYLIQLVVYNALPPSEVSLRLLSALADLLSVYLVYAVGRRFIGEWPAVFAAAFQATAIRVLWFAQEARAYSLGMMLTLLLALTLLRLADRPSWRRAAVHTLVAVALLYTHVYSTFALMGIEMAVLLSPGLLRRVGKYWWTAAGVTAVAYIPWVFALGSQIGTRSEMAGAGEWTLAPPVGTFGPVIKAVGEFAPGAYTPIPYVGPSNWGVPLFIAVVFFGLLGRRGFDELPERWGTWALSGWQRRALLVAWGGMLLVGGVVISHRILPVYSWRMATQATPVLFLAAANGVRLLWRPVGIALLAVFLAFTLAGLKPYYVDEGRGKSLEKEDWRSAIRYAAEKSETLDEVLVTPPWHIERMQAYGEMLGEESLPAMTGVARGLRQEELAEKVAGDTAGARRVLVIASHVPIGTDGLTELERALLIEGWQQASVDDVRFVRIRIYEAP